jgi:dolichol-phosphate mannosyltransferase
MKLSVVIPCYNEAENVAGLKETLTPVLANLSASPRWQEVELILVDDGSKDDTARLLEEAFAGLPNVKLIRHGVNKGLGAALRTGFAASSGDIVINTDSDATYPFSGIEPMLERLTAGVDIVTASPYHPQGGVDNVPAYRIFISKGASLCYRILLNPRIHTYTSMFRAYRRAVLVESLNEDNGFLGVTEILVRGVLNGAKVVEYPCRLRVRRYGQSKARIVQITRSHLNFMRRLLLHRVGSLFGKKVFTPHTSPQPVLDNRQAAADS